MALHNCPGYPEGQIIVKEGSCTTAVCSMSVVLTGKEAHASEPGKGLNPSETVADIIIRAVEINRKNSHNAFITPVYTQIGKKAYGTAAGFGETHFTLRASAQSALTELRSTFEKSIRLICRRHGISYSINFFEEFVSVVNDSLLTSVLTASAAELGLPVHIKDTPFPWGEDFGTYTAGMPGLLFGIGTGTEQEPLHAPHYRFNDAVITPSLDLLKEFIHNFLK